MRAVLAPASKQHSAHARLLFPLARRASVGPPCRVRRLDNSSGDFNTQEGEELEEFIEHGLCKHLRAKVRLGEPVANPTEDGG